jgi:hypothetical protein
MIVRDHRGLPLDIGLRQIMLREEECVRGDRSAREEKKGEDQNGSASATAPRTQLSLRCVQQLPAEVLEVNLDRRHR